MEIATNIDGTKATIEVTGKLTVANSQELEECVRQLSSSGDIVDYDIDLSKLEYVSSAGLRVLVATQKLAGRRGGALTLLHPSSDVMEVLEITGLSEVLSIIQ